MAWFTHHSSSIGDTPTTVRDYRGRWGGCYLGQRSSVARVPSPPKRVGRGARQVLILFSKTSNNPSEKIIQTVSLITPPDRAFNQVNPLKIRFPPLYSSRFPFRPSNYSLKPEWNESQRCIDFGSKGIHEIELSIETSTTTPGGPSSPGVGKMVASYSHSLYFSSNDAS